MAAQLTASVAQLSQSVSSLWAFVEPLFVFWLDIVYNERWLVNLFKCLCYFSLRRSAIHPPRPSPAPAALTHPPAWVTFFRGVWARVRGNYWPKDNSHGVQVQLLGVHIWCKNEQEFNIVIRFSYKDTILVSPFLLRYSTCIFLIMDSYSSCPPTYSLPTLPNTPQMWRGGCCCSTVTILPNPPEATYTNWTSPSACYSFHWGVNKC